MDRLDAVIEYAKKWKPEKKTRVIYMLSCGEYTKIGFASNMMQRFSSYKVHNPHQVKMICNRVHPNPEAFENFMFEHYHSKLHWGEWFKLSDDDIASIIGQWFSHH